MLRPSLIEGAGVGCFAVNAISQGARLYFPDNAPNRKLAKADISDAHLKYCPLLESGLYLAPANFATMSVVWYINHARDPNVEAIDWKLFTAKDIEPNEELTLYYPDLLTHPKNAEWVVQALHV